MGVGTVERLCSLLTWLSHPVRLPRLGHMDSHQPEGPTLSEMLGELLDLATGLGILLLPLGIMAIPCLILLLPLAVPLLPLALVAPPFLLTRAGLRRLRS